MNDFASQLKQARSVAGLSQAQAAKLLGVCRQTVKSWEAGRREPPDNPILSKPQIIETIRSQK